MAGRSATRRRVAAPRPRADGDRLLGPAPRVDGHLRWPCWSISALSLWQRGLVLGIDFEGGVAWDVPAGELTIDDARDVLDDDGIESDKAKIQERNSDSGDIIKVQVEDQPEEVRVRGPGGVRRGGRRRPGRRQRGVGQRHVGRGDHAQGGHRAGRVPRPDRRVHLVPLRVADGADGPAGDDPRRRHQRRHLLGVRLRGHAGDGRSPSSPCSATRCTTASSCSTASATTSGASPRPA